MNLWKMLIQRRLNANDGRGVPISDEEITKAGSILFAVFARYGDSIVTFKLLRDFVKKYPGKRYLLITTPQALPYAESIVPPKVSCVGFNKHRSIIKLWRLSRLLRRKPFDIGFNPWSHGLESEYFITFAKRFHPYRLFASFPRTHNLYDRIRGYLGLKEARGEKLDRHLPEGSGRLYKELPEQAERILISPFSTDVRKSLDRKDLEKLITWLKGLYGSPEITLAFFPKEEEKLRGLQIKKFYFSKTYKGSKRFLELINSSDLFIGVDAGPLHLADVLGIPAVGLFGPTAPETILDRDSGILPLRSDKMRGWFCDILHCTDPECLHELFKGSLLPVPVDFYRSPTLVADICPLRIRMGEM